MTLATYADLVSSVQAYEDDSSTVVSGVVDDMVTLAEQRIFHGYGRPGLPFYSPPLRVRSMEKNAVIPIGPGLDGGTAGGTVNALTVTLSSVPTLQRGLMIKFKASLSNTGDTTLNPNATGDVSVKKGANRDALEEGDIVQGGYYTVYHDGTYFVLMPSDGACPLPSRFLGIRGAYIQDRAQPLFPSSATGINPRMKGATARTPLYYAVDGYSLRFDALPDQSYMLNLNYYARPAALSISLNDIFRGASGIYLFGALLELALYLPNVDAQQRHHAQFMGSLMAYQDSQKAASFGDAPMRLRLPIAP